MAVLVAGYILIVSAVVFAVVTVIIWKKCTLPGKAYLLGVTLCQVAASVAFILDYKPLMQIAMAAVGLCSFLLVLWIGRSQHWQG